MKIFLFQFFAIIFFFNLFLLSCNNKEVKIVKYKYKNSIIIDTASDENIFIDYDKKYRGGFYLVYYAGPIIDSINLPTKPLSPFYYSEINYQLAALSVSKNIEIFVDTNANVNIRTEYYNCLNDGSKPILDSVKNYKSLLVFVTNNGDSLIQIGKFNYLQNTIRQVFYKGEWKDIEYIETGFCGTGAREIYLDKNEIAVAKLFRYEGAKKYLCRLRMTSFYDAIYSNSFLDYVDERQLKDSLIKHY